MKAALLHFATVAVQIVTISMSCLHRSEKEPQFKFIYFNHMNLAEKSTIHMRKTPSVSLTSVHPDLMKILGDINSDFTRCFQQLLTGDCLSEKRLKGIVLTYFCLICLFTRGSLYSPGGT